LNDIIGDPFDESDFDVFEIVVGVEESKDQIKSVKSKANECNLGIGDEVKAGKNEKRNVMQSKEDSAEF
jgi:hypothetical protein